MGPDQRRLERQSSMPSERPKSNYGNYPMRYFKISAYGALPSGMKRSQLCSVLSAPPGGTVPLKSRPNSSKRSAASLMGKPHGRLKRSREHSRKQSWVLVVRGVVGALPPSPRK